MGRSLIASEIGIKRAEEALIDLGFTKTFLAETKLLCSRSTVTSFFGRKPITHENFNKICSALKLQWRDIAEREKEVSVQSLVTDEILKPVDLLITSTTKSIKPELEQPSNDVNLENKQPYLILTVMDFDKQVENFEEQVDNKEIGEIVRFLQRITIDDSIKIIEIQGTEFGTALTLAGTAAALVKIKTLHELRELTEVKRKFITRIGLENLSGSDFSGSDLCRADLSGADLSKSNFSKSNLSGAKLSGADLTEADLTETKLTEANLTKAKLIRTNLTEAKLIRANLTEADLTEAKLIRANLTEANLLRADLTEADITEADLTKTKLIQAILWRVNFGKVNSVEFAAFGSNNGMSQEVLSDLKTRGATIDNDGKFNWL